MKIFWFIILLMLLSSWPESTTSGVETRIFFPIALLLRLVPMVGNIINQVFKLWNTNPTESIDITSTSYSNAEHNMYRQLIEISSKITDLEHEIEETSDLTITKILHAFPKILKLELNMHELKLVINQINFAEEQMRNYLILGYSKMQLNKKNTTSSIVSNQNSSLSNLNDRNNTIQNNTIQNNTIQNNTIQNNTIQNDTIQNYTIQNNTIQNNTIQNDTIQNNTTQGNMIQNVTFKSYTSTTTEENVDMRLARYTMENFAMWATDHSFNSLMSLLRRLHDLIVPIDGDGIFNLILQVSKDVPHSTCILSQSLHQTLYNLYNSITIAELKGNTIIQFSYMILQMYQKGNFTDEATLALQNYQKYSELKLEVIREALLKADRTLYKCDPKQYKDGVTHTKLTRLLIGYVENEININRDRTCWKTCENYQDTKYYGCRGRHEFCAYQSKCRGKIINCRYIYPDMDICVSKNPERRYDWIKYENGRTFGHKGSCRRKDLYDVNSWLTWFFFRCAYCICLCDDIGNGSDRYFNLREVTSDIEKNKVVTGLRIVKENKIVHIQIQQGVLTPFGLINRTSLTWKPVDNYTLNHSKVKNNKDYYTMGEANRIIDTNEMFGPSEHVVTGLRFRRLGKHLNLEVRVTPINFTSGEVSNVNKSLWLGNYKNGVNTNYGTTEIELSEPDIPTRKGPHTVISKHYHYIKFQPTTYKSDAGQTTVPFFDSQALTSQGFPISGIGLIHRGKWKSGGFIAPKIISYDFTPHISLNKTN